MSGSINPNDAQAQASDPTASAWVTANAGSGKTKVLIDRVARLLLGHAKDPSRILCLTFTKAAAANMQNKLFAQLGRWALMENDDLQKELRKLGANIGDDVKLNDARKLFAQALETPGGLKIQTIHSFCESLLRRFPLEAGLSPHFSQIDDTEAAQMHAEALDRVLSRGADGDDAALTAAVDRVVIEAQEFGIRALVPEIVRKRKAFEGETDTLIDAMRGALKVAPGDSESTALARFFTETPVGDVKELAAAFRNGGKNEQKQAASMEPLLQSDLMRDWVQALTIAVLTGGKPRVIGTRYPTKAVREANPDIAEKLETFQTRLIALQDELTALAAAERSAHMIVFAKAVLEETDAIKRTTDGLDFDDLIRRASTLLNDSAASAWVRYKLDGGVDHILVDEAQDTSPEQWQVISAIAEEFFAGIGAREETHRTLFVVGDEKQSIFSFQGAQPEELDKVRDRFRELVTVEGRETLREPLLLHSFRSTPAVLEMVSRVFADPVAAKGLNVDNELPKHLAFRADAPGRVEFWPPIGRLEEEKVADWWEPVDQMAQDAPEIRLARGIVDRIESWLKNETILPAKGRPIRAGDILILVRRRNAFADAVIRLMKARDLPVAGKDRMMLREQMAVRDLMALVRFVLLPDDDLALATVLRSPLVGLSEEDLYTLAQERTGRLWPALYKRRDEPAFGSAFTMLNDMLDRADYLRPYEFLERTLTLHGGRGRLLTRLGAQAADPIDELLAQALAYETRGIPTLQGFVERIEASEVEIKREMEQGRNEIRVMTVHGSKGLEANVVFMPDICAVPTDRGDTRVYEVNGGPIWSPSTDANPAPVRELRDVRKERELQEYRRLLYVGMTRAQDWLILCGWHGAKPEKERDLKAESWAALVEKSFGEGAVEGPTPLLNSAGKPVISQVFDIGGTEVKDDAASGDDALESTPLEAELLAPPPAEDSAPPPIAPSRVGAGIAEPFVPMPPPSENEDGEPSISSAERGTALHLLLERLAEVEPEARAALAETLADDDPALIAPALAVLDNPDFAWMFGPDSMAEVPVQGPVSALAGRSVLGTIDRLVVTDDTVHVIDFKSGRPAVEVPQPYQRQLALYRAALNDIFPQRTVLAHLVWIDGNIAVTVDDDALDAALAKMLADGSLDAPRPQHGANG